MSDPSPASTTSEQTLWTGTVSNVHYVGKWLLVLILLAVLVASFIFALPALPFSLSFSSSSAGYRSTAAGAATP